MMDAPVDFGSGWTPGEWDNLERGPVRMRLALQGSLNIPAIKTAIRTGADRIWSDMSNGVFKFLGDDNYAGASIAIGTLESRYIDMLSAYSALANEGDAVPRRYILQIQDRNGEPIWSAASPASERRSVMEPAVANLVTNIIAGNTDPSQNPVWADRRRTAENGKRRPATRSLGGIRRSTTRPRSTKNWSACSTSATAAAAASRSAIRFQRCSMPSTQRPHPNSIP